jgi:excisionase family DNA binding protein
MTAHLELRQDDMAVSHLLKPVLNPSECAEYLGVSTGTLLRRARAGEIPCRRLGNKIRFFIRKEIDEWVNALPGRTVGEAMSN